MFTVIPDPNYTADSSAWPDHPRGYSLMDISLESSPNTARIQRKLVLERFSCVSRNI